MICIGLGYGVMVAQDILVVLVLVRNRVAQPLAKGTALLYWEVLSPLLIKEQTKTKGEKVID